MSTVRLLLPKRTQIYAVDDVGLAALKQNKFIKITSIKPYELNKSLHTVAFKYVQSNTNEHKKPSNSTQSNKK